MGENNSNVHVPEGAFPIRSLNVSLSLEIRKPDTRIEHPQVEGTETRT